MAHGEYVHLEHHSNKNEVRNVTIILTVVTLIELGLGYMMIGMEHASKARLYTKIAIIILMLSKAYYITGYFMHLKHELNNFIMTILVPLVLFTWFILAFLADGDSYLNLRNNYDPHFKEQSKKPGKAQEHHNESNTHEIKAEGAHH